MRTFEKTHPWLKNFNVDLQKVNYNAWLLVGEAVSKSEHIAGVPLSPEAANKLHEVFLAKGVLATTAIEGNTLTEEEVIEHLEGKLELPPSRQYLTKEIDNIVDACNQISRQIIERKELNITPEEIASYNSLVLRELPLKEGVVPGKIRTHSVGVGRYRCVPAKDCSYLLDQFCQWLNSLNLPEEHKSSYSILVAIAAHLYFVWIHPFGDGNGRTARLIEFRYLLQAGFPTPAAHLLSNFYNLTRTEYYRQLDIAGKKHGDLYGFIDYAIQGFVDQLREQLKTIRNLQWDTAWENYVYKLFGKSGKAQARRRRVVLALSNVNENKGWVHTASIQDLTPQLAREYAGKTRKTLSRDLNGLAHMGLIIQSDKLVKANKDLILAFLPSRVD